MNMRIVVAALAACLLAGCTDADWDHTMSYVGLGPATSAEADPPGQPAAAPVAQTDPAAGQPAASDQWCREVARAAATEAVSNGFDAATQQHRAQVSYSQCLGSTAQAAR